MKTVDSSSRGTRHTAELAISSAPAILSSLVSVFLQRHPLFRSAALVAEPTSVFIVLLQTYVPVSLRRCSMSENIFLFRIKSAGNFSCKNDVSQLDAQSVDILCMSVISTHAFSLCGNGMAAAFGPRFFFRNGHCRERKSKYLYLRRIFSVFLCIKYALTLMPYVS